MAGAAPARRHFELRSGMILVFEEVSVRKPAIRRRSDPRASPCGHDLKIRDSARRSR